MMMNVVNSLAGNGKQKMLICIRMGTALVPCLAFLALQMAGCAQSPHAKRHFNPASGGGGSMDEVPAFLTGPVGMVLTNSRGFACHVALETGVGSRTANGESGELQGFNGKLLYTPQFDAAGKRKSQNGIGYLWDPGTETGYVLSEALQSYAPISSNLRFTNFVTRPVSVAFESKKIQGHQCRLEEWTAVDSPGSIIAVQVWRAEDLSAFPIEITAEGSGTNMTLRLSKVRFITPESSEFVPPDGFTRYDSAQAMRDELVLRQHTPRPGRSDEEGGRMSTGASHHNRSGP
jgi:hypothetical protein